MKHFLPHIIYFIFSFLIFHFSSAQSVDTLPLSIDFENGNEGWTFLNDSNAWIIGDAVSHSGSRCLYISNHDNIHSYAYTGSNVTSSSFAYRTIHITEPGEYLISFHWMGNGESSYDYLRAFLAPDNIVFQAGDNTGITTSNLPAGCIALDGGNKLNGQSSWQYNERSIEITNTGVYKLIFYWRNDHSVGHLPPAAVDDIFFGPYTCHPPTNITLHSSTDSSLTLQWTSQNTNEPNQWIVTIDSRTLLADSSTFTIDGLAPNTSYPVTLQHYCGTGDFSPLLFDTFRTACIPASIPYNDGFEGDNLICWTLHDGNSASGYTGISSATPHSGSQSLRLYPGNASQPVFVISPFLGNLDTLMSIFHLRGSSMVHVDIGSVTNPLDTNTFTPVASIDALDPSWQAYEICFDTHTGGNHLAFRFATSSSYGFSAYLDDITVVPAPTCRPPLAVVIDSIGAEALRIHVTDTATPPLYHLLLLASNGDTLVNITFPGGGTLAGLTPATDYTLAISTICTDGNETSATLLAIHTPSLIPVVQLEGPSLTTTFDSINLHATLLDGNTDSIVYSWHSTLLDTTFVDSIIHIVYFAGGIDTISLTATNHYGSGFDTIIVSVMSCPLIDSYPYTEKFEYDNPCWISLDADGDGHSFARCDTLDSSGLGIMISESFDTSFPRHNLYPDNWLLSPLVQLPSDSATLTWNDYSSHQYPAEHYTVYILSSLSTLHSPLSTLFDTTLTQGGWNNRAVDLTPYLGQTVRFAFRHHNCSGQLFLGLDSITVSNTALYHPTPPPTPHYTLTLFVNDLAMGNVSGAGTYDSASLVTIEAIAIQGHHFDGWNDGDTSNPRQLFVVKDTTFTAFFSVIEDTVTIPDISPITPHFSLSPNPSHGDITIRLNEELRIENEIRIDVIDMTGRVVSSARDASDFPLTLHLPLPAGTYFVRITSSKGTSVQKFMYLCN